VFVLSVFSVCCLLCVCACVAWSVCFASCVRLCVMNDVLRVYVVCLALHIL